MHGRHCCKNGPEYFIKKSYIFSVFLVSRIFLSFTFDMFNNLVHLTLNIFKGTDFIF